MNENQYFSEPDEKGIRYYQSEEAEDARVNQAVTKPKNHSLRNSLIVLGVIITAIAVLGASCNSVFQVSDTEITLPSSTYIATVYVEGAISSGNTDTWGNPNGYQHSWTLKEIDRLMEDYNNRGIILYVDSPGGGVFESDELYFKIKEYQEVTGNPVYAAMASMAASGGYYISAPAEKIYANRNCWTGSIGVTMGTLLDISGFLDNYGVKTTTITSGRNKAMGSYFDPLTDEQASILRSLIDEAYDQFTGIVAEERGIPMDRVREIADGRIYTAAQALKLDLIDVIGTYDEALEAMKDDYGLGDCEVVDIYFRYNSLFSNIFGKINPWNMAAPGDAAAIIQLLDKRNKAPVSYLCEILAQ